ncbi:MAG TPA: hypothetical protein P5293_05675 [Bacteroidales bacterium]|nr:hypothetical protein [Bacteroidales bacterium]
MLTDNNFLLWTNKPLDEVWDGIDTSVKVDDERGLGPMKLKGGRNKAVVS